MTSISQLRLTTPWFFERRTVLELCDITGGISVLNIVPSKLSSSLSSSAVWIFLMYCLYLLRWSDSAFQVSGDRQVLIPLDAYISVAVRPKGYVSLV